MISFSFLLSIKNRQTTFYKACATSRKQHLTDNIADFMTRNDKKKTGT